MKKKGKPKQAVKEMDLMIRLKQDLTTALRLMPTVDQKQELLNEICDYASERSERLGPFKPVPDRH